MYIVTHVLEAILQKSNGFDSVNIMGGYYFYNSTK